MRPPKRHRTRGRNSPAGGDLPLGPREDSGAGWRLEMLAPMIFRAAPSAKAGRMSTCTRHMSRSRRRTAGPHERAGRGFWQASPPRAWRGRSQVSGNAKPRPRSTASVGTRLGQEGQRPDSRSGPRSSDSVQGRYNLAHITRTVRASRQVRWLARRLPPADCPDPGSLSSSRDRRTSCAATYRGAGRNKARCHCRRSRRGTVPR